MGGQAWPGPPASHPQHAGEQQGWENLEACFCWLLVLSPIKHPYGWDEGVGWRWDGAGGGGPGWPYVGPGGGGSSAGRRWVLLQELLVKAGAEEGLPERPRMLTLAFLPDGIGDGGAMARHVGPEAMLRRGLGQAVGRRVHVGQERPRHRGGGWPRKPSQGRRPKKAGFQQWEGVGGRRDQRQGLQRAGQLREAGGERGGGRRGRVRAREDGFFLRGPDNARELGQPLGWLGRGFLLQGRGSRQDGLVSFGRWRGVAGAVGADVQVLEEGAVRPEAQHAVLTPAGPRR